ncbi:MAG: hypothetical protein ONB13_10120 [candidate division KSB1 bacterium]|nr:hypothetical protein [candidate division KSB1 bacterium]MDZ7335945.1 hypothetical protein [candidate division KSB1 bacterium]MDZ7357739.1 hypothetical protein [candidate division KSB1 bacterium]MDZ7376964.1 hypothetical protein [candidate division KSB1 bacterium]MDZ7399864.1 hypothetical protein [candidate division KSB1 bacterium]
MLEGITLIALTGILWCGNGIIFSYAVRKSLNFFAIMSVSTFIGTVLFGIFQSRPMLIFNGSVARLPELILAMVSSGAIGTLGVILLHRAMRIGHHGVVWTISQFAFIIPFLFGVLAHDEPLTGMKQLGIFIILISVLAIGMGDRREPSRAGGSWIIWFSLSLAAFAVLGIHQTVTLVPNFWPNWDDKANLRGFLLNSGFFISYLIVLIATRGRLDRGTIMLGSLSGMIVFVSPITLFGAMDIFEKYQMLSMVFPLAVGICILAFVSYSALFLKEGSSSITLIGVGAGITGLVLIAI